jgi:uncharacterized repeat protein (TIGR01451 family)
LIWDFGTLGPGQSQSVDYQAKATAGGRLANKAVASAAGGARAEVEAAVTIVEPKLEVTNIGPKRRYVNAPAQYQITIKNTGNVPLAEVLLVDPLPAQASFVSAAAGGQLVGQQVHWSINALGPGESRSVELVLRARSLGQICHQVTAKAEYGLVAQAEACTEFVGVPALSLEVEDTVDPVEVGGTTVYNVVVRNPGTTPATNVQVVSVVPSQMVVLRAAGAADHHREGQKIAYDAVTIPAGGESRYQIEVKAEQAGDVRFKVELTAEQLTAGPVVQEESTTIFGALPTGRPKPLKQS